MVQEIRIARVYQDVSGSAADGYRVLVDRLWPRGESKAVFHYDLWAKELAPSASLREWFHENPDANWEEFVRRYRAELDANGYVDEFVKEISGYSVVTLLYGSRDTEHNNAEVLQAYLCAKTGAEAG